MTDYKTSEAQRRAVKNYQDTVDRVNCRFPKGTKERIKELTGKSCNAFISALVLEKLEQIENVKVVENMTLDDEDPPFMKD